jgi:hypothetical protein
MREEESEWGTGQLEKVGVALACVVGVESTATSGSCTRAVHKGWIRQAGPTDQREWVSEWATKADEWGPQDRERESRRVSGENQHRQSGPTE